MTTSSTAAPGASRRRTLDRDRVIATALEVIDETGLDGLSMRRLGVELGVEAMSLYNHVDNKDDLLDGIVRLLWDEITAAVEYTGDWRRDVWSFALGVQQVAHRHPQAFPLTLNRGALPAQALELTDGLIETLDAAGFGDVIDEVVRTVVGYSAGYLLSELAWYEDPARTPRPTAGSPGTGKDEGAPQPDAQRALLACDTEAQFRFGLEVLLDGLERLRDGHGGHQRHPPD